MVQKFYLRNALATNPPTAGEKSTVLPVDTLGANNATGDQENRALENVAGTTQTSHAFSSDNVTTARDNYLGRWTSKGVAAGTYGSGTWTIAIALSEANTNANSFLNLSVYFWRPSTNAVVGFVYDSHTNIGVEWGTSEDGQVITFTGSNITVQANDVLVVEVWRHAAQGMSAAYTQTVYFDGTTDVTDATTTDAASYLQAPADIPLSGLAIVKVVNETLNISEATNKIIGLIKNVNETLNISENTVKVLGLVKNINETLNISEVANRVLGVVKVINETLNISEVENHTLALVRIVNDTLNISEAINKTIGLVRNVVETLNITETVYKTTVGAQAESPLGHSFIYSDKKYPIQIIMPMPQTSALKPASLRKRDFGKRSLSINSSEKTARQESLSIVKISRKAESMTQSLIESPNLRMLAPISMLSFPSMIEYELGSLMRMPLRGRAKIGSFLHLPQKTKLETVNISDMIRAREIESLDLIQFIFEDDSYIAEQIDSSLFRSPRGKDHGRTSTSRKTTDLERELTKELENITNQIKRRIKQGANLQSLRNQFENRVRSIITSTVTDSYVLGVKFISKIDDSSILRPEDLQKIQKEANQLEQDYWEAIADIKKKSDDEISSMAGIIAGLATFGLLSLATRDKIKQHNLQAPEDDIGLYWITERDAKVCPICEPLDGKVVKDDEQFFLDPPAKAFSRTVRYLNGPPAHPNCRCRMLPWKNGRVFLA